MNKKKVGKTKKNTQKKSTQAVSHARPSWVPASLTQEAELCPDCFKVVGEKSRYNLVCMLGQMESGMTVGEMTERMGLRQPTITHHLQVLHSVAAVTSESRGRERVYRLNRDAHCFEECKIPY